ncbi:hypothetical protein ABIF14_008806 [Bradyrhizobium elkanii]
MCNAWNHSASCPCAFGPGGGGGWGRGGGFYSAREIDISPSWGRERRPTVASYVNPNARCPVCGAQVFFYRSPYNGRVFFDSLGWPWPKHHCTDRRNETRSATPSTMPTWQREGWQPLMSSRAHTGTAGHTVTGDVEGDYHQLHLAAGQPVDNASPVFVRQIARKPDLFDVTYLSSDAFGTYERKTVGFLEAILPVGTDIIGKAAEGDAAATYEIGRYLLWEANSPFSAAPYIEAAAIAGVFDAQVDLAILQLLPIAKKPN